MQSLITSALFIIISSMIACGGGSSSSSSDTTDDDAITTESLQSLSNLPDMDIDSLDVAGASSESNLTRALVKKVVDGEQEFSAAGCEVRSQVDEMKQQFRQFQQNLCIMKSMEEAAGMTVGLNSYNYYDVDFGDEMPGVRVKLGLIDDTLRLYVCDEGDSGYAQHTAMTFTVTDGAFNGVVTDSFTDPATSENFAHRVSALIATDNPDEFANGDTATLTGDFTGGWGSGTMDLDITKSDDEIINTLTSTFQSGDTGAEWGSWTSLVHGQYNADGGCAKFSSTGEFPAQLAGSVFPDEALAETDLEAGDLFCWKDPDDPDADDNNLGDFVEAAGEDGMCDFSHSDTACFLYELGDTLQYYVDDSGTSAFLSGVSATTLGTYTAPTITFTADETWDCTAAGGVFTSLDATGSVRSTVEANCMEDLSDRGAHESCYDQEKDEQVSSDLGIEVTDDADAERGREVEEEAEEEVEEEDVEEELSCPVDDPFTTGLSGCFEKYVFDPAGALNVVQSDSAFDALVTSSVSGGELTLGSRANKNTPNVNGGTGLAFVGQEVTAGSFAAATYVSSGNASSGAEVPNLLFLDASFYFAAGWSEFSDTITKVAMDGGGPSITSQSHADGSSSAAICMAYNGSAVSIYSSANGSTWNLLSSNNHTITGGPSGSYYVGLGMDINNTEGDFTTTFSMFEIDTGTTTCPNLTD